MYRNFFKNTLTTEKLKKQNFYSPDDIKYCNGACQDFRLLDDFSCNTMICKKCINQIGLAKKAIKDKKITIEEFVENPLLFETHINQADILQTKVCRKCKEDKSLIHFYDKKAVCKACLCLEKSTKNSNIEKEIHDIEELKNNLQILEKYITNIPKDKLVNIISHFSIGRKSTDTKHKMIENVILYFRKLQNPLLCQGGCGFILKEELSTCKDCENKKNRQKSLSGMRNTDFQDSIDDIIQELKSGIKDHEYNKEQVFQMARKLGIGTDIIKQEDTKEKVLVSLNTFLHEKEEKEKQEETKLLENAMGETKEYELMLNGVNVLARETDGFINATAMCKAGGKRFNDWNRLESTKELIEELKSEIEINRSAGIPADLLIDSIMKGPNDKRGTWIHPDLAVQLAQWISPKFALQVSRWVREIAITGTVSIGSEKTNEQLYILQTKVREEKQKFKELELKHNSVIYRRNYHKFNKGPIFYIISDGDNTTPKYKVGIDDVDINVRLQQHRTSIPDLSLHLLIYTNKNKCLEETILSRHEESRKPYLNHEWLFDVELKSLIDSTMTYLNFINADYTIENDIEKYN